MPNRSLTEISKPLKLTEDEVQEFRDQFETFDKNKDGRISAKEFQDVLASAGLKISDAEVEEVIRQADRDGNGTIEWDEFLKAMTHSKRRDSLSESSFRQTFQVFDQDGDGFISRAELENVVTQLGLQYVYTGDMVEKLFQQVDADKDGKINLDEFLVAMERGL